MSAAAQTARMVLRAPEAKSRVAIRMPVPAVRAAQAAAAVPVSRSSDPAEREAESVSRRIIAMPAAAVAPQPRRFARAVPATSNIPAALGVGSSGGQPLPRLLRRDMEPRFQADFSNVRVHTGDAAASASRRLNAAAFTSGRDVFFGRGRFQPDAPAGRELIAHELTHTVQQGAATQNVVQRSLDSSRDAQIRERTPPQTVHRLGIQDALDYFADKAAWVPGFSMLALLLGFNPVSLRAVPRTAANLLRAMVQLIPGGPLITQALDNHGIVDKVANWAEGQLSALGDIGASIRQAIDDFLDGLGWSDIFDLGGVWERAKRIVTGPIDRIIAFGAGLVSGIITFIKDAILRPIAGLIEPTRGYPLLKAILGFDPVTGDAVPRTPATLLGGFMTLIGQEEIWQNIQKGNAIGQAYAWFEGALAGLMTIVTAIPATFLAAFQSLQLVDIILVPRAFARIIGVFGSIAGQFLSWGLGTVIKLLEIIFSVVAPGAMAYLRRAGGAIQGIFRNPIGFVMNLVNAAKAGFQRFGRNILRHLQASLISWLTGSLPGIYIPQALSLPEILKFVLSVLGLSWANIR
ncbi:eCIS core domain-containing protein, partial [Roseateles sp. GG27B]